MRADLSGHGGEVDFAYLSAGELVAEQLGGPLSDCDQHNTAHRSIQAMWKRHVIGAFYQLVSQPRFKAVDSVGRLSRNSGRFLDHQRYFAVPKDFNLGADNFVSRS